MNYKTKITRKSTPLSYVFLSLMICFLFASCDLSDGNLPPSSDQENIEENSPSLPSDNLVEEKQYPHIIKEEDRIQKSFETLSYPQPVPTAPYYFINQLPVTIKQYPIRCPIMKCYVNLEQLISLNDVETMTYINQQIAILLSQWIDSGLPMYPGQSQWVKNSNIAAITYSAKIDSGINDIMKLSLSTNIILMSQLHIIDEQFYYFDLRTGRQFTLNDIMNSTNGLDELNRLVFNSIDAYSDPDDSSQDSHYHRNPFHSSFTSLPETVSLLLDAGYSTVILNDDCQQCFFSFDYSALSPIQIGLKDSPISLYERSFDPKISSHVSNGDFVLNLRNQGLFTENEQHTIIDEKRQLEIIGPDLDELPSYLISHLNQMIKKVLMEAEKFGDLSKNNFNVYLSYSRNRLFETISVSYYISNRDSYISDTVIKNFDIATHNEIKLQDVFAPKSNFIEYLKQIIKSQSSFLEYNITLDEILADIDQIDFQINMESLTLNTLPYPFKNDEKSRYSIVIDIPWSKIGLENISPYLLATD